MTYVFKEDFIDAWVDGCNISQTQFEHLMDEGRGQIQIQICM